MIIIDDVIKFLAALTSLAELGVREWLSKEPENEIQKIRQAALDGDTVYLSGVVDRLRENARHHGRVESGEDEPGPGGSI